MDPKREVWKKLSNGNNPLKAFCVYVSFMCWKMAYSVVFFYSAVTEHRVHSRDIMNIFFLKYPMKANYILLFN